jgi:small-conductance mechanosensitive channel
MNKGFRMRFWPSTHNPLLEFMTDVQQHAIAPQLGAALCCLGLAWLINRWLAPRLSDHGGLSDRASLRHGVAGALRVLFPVSASLLLLLATAILSSWSSTGILKLLNALMLAMAVVRVLVYLIGQAFPHSPLLQRFDRVIAMLVWSGFALHATGLLPPIIHWLDSLSLRLGKTDLSLWMVLNGAVSVVVIILLSMWLSGVAERRVMRVDALDINLRVVVTKVIRALLLFVGALIALPVIGIDLTVLSVFGGALGVGLGFGLQKIASNYVSGFILLLDRSVNIGDMVTINEHQGTITSITGRYVVLKSANGTEAIIPNETLITSTVVNQCHTDNRVRVELPVQISYQSNLDTAMQLMCEAARSAPRVLPDPAPEVVIRGFGASGIDLTLLCWIDDPENGQLLLKSTLYRQIWQDFQHTHIEIPYPRQDVSIVNHAGQVPPGSFTQATSTGNHAPAMHKE